MRYANCMRCRGLGKTNVIKECDDELTIHTSYYCVWQCRNIRDNNLTFSQHLQDSVDGSPIECEGYNGQND